ncbi:MAG: PAS domain-containing sensor histidine kinase [Thermodesulfobacteriota bacterium]
MYRKLKISTKIWLSLSILVIGYFISMLFGFILGEKAEFRLHIVSESLFTAAKQSQLAQMAFKEQIKNFNDGILLGEMAFIESAEVKAGEVSRALQIILGLRDIDSPKKERVRKLEQDLKEFNTAAWPVYSRLSAFLDYVAEIEAEDVFREREKLENQAFALAKKTEYLGKELDALSADFSDELKKELADIGSLTLRQRYLSLIVFFVVVISAVSLIILIVTRSISRPLEKTFMLESAVEQSGDGISVSDMSGRIQFVNSAWASMHGYEPQELIGGNITVCHSRDQVEKELYPFIDTVKTMGANSGEVGHMRKDGTVFVSMMTMTLLRDEDERKIRIVSIARDITEQKENEKELRKAKEVAEDANRALQESLKILKQTQYQLIQSEKMASLGSLVAGIAHEINTPVGVGVTASSFLEEKTKEYAKRLSVNEMTKSDVRKYMNIASEASTIILNNLNRAADLIRSFKQVAVDQSGEARRKFKLKEYIDELFISLRPKYKRTPHTITVNCPDEIEIDSYPGVFSQVITNLLMNSLTHGLEGMEAGEIKIDIRLEGSFLYLIHQDNGIGMDAQTLNKIFDPFFTTRRGQGGTGLGLNIVYNLVTRTLGGQIECQSSPGKGTTFIVSVPLNA